MEEEHDHVQKEKSVANDEESIEREDDLAEVSFVSNSTDDSYIYVVEADQNREEKVCEKLFYLSMQEIAYESSQSVHRMDANSTFEERLLLSSITYKESQSMLPAINQFSQGFAAILKEFRRSIKFNSPLGLSSIATLPKKEHMLSYLPPIASAKKVNVGCNKETNFIIKHVAFLIEAVVNSSRLHLEWDATPNCYLNCDLNIQHCRHDLILYAKDGTEIATGEVKPCNASDILAAHGEKELYTYGIMINGDNIQLSTLHLSVEGEYECKIDYEAVLATSYNIYAFMEETLEILIQFICMAEDSLIEPEEMNNDLILSKYSKLLKPTVYMIADESL